MAESKRNTDLEEEVFDYDAYAEVARSANLERIFLCESSFGMKPEGIVRIERDFHELRHLIEGKTSWFVFDEETGTASGGLSWAVRLKDGRKNVLKLECSYLLFYVGMEKCNEKYVQAYFDKVGKFACYPYFRADFAHAASSAGVTLPPLPSLRDRVD